MAALESDSLYGRDDTSAAEGEACTKRVEVRKDKTNPRRFAYLILLLFASPPGWGLFIVGAMLVIGAVLFHGWAAGYLARAGYKERAKILTVRGPYRYNRNPYYVAHLTMDFGFFCVAGLPLLYLLYFPVIYSVYRRWVVNEEPFLENEFGDDYLRFKQEVPRWRIRFTPAPPRGREQVFTWAMFRLNNEFPRAASHLIILGIFTCYFLFGNPWVSVDPLVRATLVGVIAIWFLLHDIYPLDVSRIHAGWLLLAVVTIVTSAGFLIVTPVWERWPITPSWIAITIGIVLGLFTVFMVLPVVTRATGKTLNHVLPQPMSQWYIVGLGLGLATLTIGGVWIGILVPFLIWALGLAGILPIRSIPQSAAMGLSLIVGFSLFAGYGLGRLLG
jgi:hypothetical protein